MSKPWNSESLDSIPLSRIYKNAVFIEKNCFELIEDLDYCTCYSRTNKIVAKIKEISTNAISMASNVLSLLNVQAESIELKEKMTDLNQKLQDQEIKFQDQEMKFANQNKKIQSLEKILFNDENYDQIPHLGIETNTIFDLNGGDQQSGWKIINHKPEKVEELSTRKIIKLGVLGPYDSGKTYLCNLLSGGRLPSGAKYRTSAIEICYPEQDGVHFGVIDVPGSQEAHRVSDPILIKKLPKKEKDVNSKESILTSRGEEEIKESKQESTADYFDRYRLLHNDSKLIHDLKEKFITENADIVVVVCNKLSDSDQEMVYKIMKHYKDTRCNRIADRNTNTTALTQKQLYIVHNFKMLSKIEDVQNQIQKDIKLCFEVEESDMFNFEEGAPLKEGQKVNSVLYRDQFGIAHLALAASGTEAGDYYNTKTLEFLRSKLRNTDCKTSFDLCSSFLKFCNEHLKKMLSKPVTLKYNKDKTAFVKEEPDDFQIDSLAWNSLGDFISTSGQYQPRYSMTTSQIDELTTQVVVEVEVLDCKIEKSKIQTEDGNPVLKLSGEKKAEPFTSISNQEKKSDVDSAKQQNLEFVNVSREEGRFDLKIKLQAPVDTKKQHSSTKENLGNGVVRYTFVFKKHDGDDI